MYMKTIRLMKERINGILMLYKLSNWVILHENKPMRQKLLAFTCLIAGITIGTAHSSYSQSVFSEATQLQAVYTADFFGNINGGIDQGARYMDNLDLTLNVDGETAFGIEGTRLFVYGLANQGGNLTELVGDAQVVSNIEAQNSWRLYEAWFQYINPDTRSSLLAGLYDLNAEFDINNTGALFINSSHGIGAEYAASGITGPSIFPLTSLSARYKLALSSRSTFKIALLDGVPSDPGNTRGTKVFLRENDGALLAAELAIFGNGREGYRSLNNEDKLSMLLDRQSGNGFHNKLAIGGWYYTQERASFSVQGAGEPTNNWGAYVLGEGRLYTEGSSATQGLSAFVRAGIANPDINRFESYVGTGLVYTGPFKGLDRDRVGLALAMAFNSDNRQDVALQQGMAAEKGEYNIELTYQSVISSWLNLQWNTQYIIHPNTLSSIDNAWVMGIRASVSLNP